MDATKETVIRLYEQGNSINRISQSCEITVGKVRKILVTAGLYSSKRSEEIQGLQRKGMSPTEIAKALKISRATVDCYLPYEKGIYNAEYQTINALRIKKCREKKKALDNSTDL